MPGHVAPLGMAFYPGTETLWTTCDERDEMGDDLPPDFLTSVKPGGFYGWPYAYIGPNPEPRLEGKPQDGRTIEYVTFRGVTLPK